MLGGCVVSLKGPCTQIVCTLALKCSPYIGTLGPKYMLLGHLDF